MHCSAHTRHSLEVTFFAAVIAALTVVCVMCVMHRAEFESFARGVEIVETCEHDTCALEDINIGTETLANLYL